MNISDMKFMTVFDMPVSEIVFAPFNPTGRTERRAIRQLMKSVKSAGRVIEPVKLSRDGILGDGHRRVTCAIALGIVTVPAIRYDMSEAELFALNGDSRKPNDQEWSEAYAKGMNKLPANKERKINAFLQVMGSRDFAILTTERRVSPYVYTIAKSVCRYCDNLDIEFARTVVWWLVNNNMQRAAIGAMASCIDPDLLENAIMANKKLAQNWGMID